MELISEFGLEIKKIKGKENRVADTLSQSVWTIHLVTTSVGESNINKIIRTLLQEYDFFNQVRT
jgi:hypothetical protein